jgi:hypothetical protein
VSIGNRQSALADFVFCQSPIANRKSTIETRQSAIDNHQSVVPADEHFWW